MASRPKRPQKAEPLPPTPLDARQRALKEQERKLQESMARCEKLIQDAPKLAAERAREQREEIIRRAARTDHRSMSAAALPDRRFEANVAAPAQHRRMRAERRQGRLTFFVLLLTLAAAIFFLYYTVTHG